MERAGARLAPSINLWLRGFGKGSFTFTASPLALAWRVTIVTVIPSSPATRPKKRKGHHLVRMMAPEFRLLLG